MSFSWTIIWYMFFCVLLSLLTIFDKSCWYRTVVANQRCMEAIIIKDQVATWGVLITLLDSFPVLPPPCYHQCHRSNICTHHHRHASVTTHHNILSRSQEIKTIFLAMFAPTTHNSSSRIWATSLHHPPMVLIITHALVHLLEKHSPSPEEVVVETCQRLRSIDIIKMDSELKPFISCYYYDKQNSSFFCLFFLGWMWKVIMGQESAERREVVSLAFCWRGR